MTPIRLNRFLALCGVGSRRRCDEYIAAGRITISGSVVAEMGFRVSPDSDVVSFDGQPVQAVTVERLIMLNKPKEYIVTAEDTHGRPTVFDLLEDVEERIFPIGRLDYDTEGLLLLTNNGELAHRIAHPKYNVRKNYHALMTGIPSESALETLRQGIMLDDGMTAPAKVRLLRARKDKALVEIKIIEGRKREVRRMGEAIGHPVIDLKRVAIDRLKLTNLAVGKWRDLSKDEVDMLKRRVNI